MIFAIDVDLTFYPTDRHWWDWIFLKMKRFPEPFPTDINPKIKMDYDLSQTVQKLYPEVVDCDPFSFWRKEDTYENIEPLPYAVEALHLLHQHGHTVLFVSAIKGNHHKSKYYQLKKHVPFMGGLIATKEKQYVRCDAVIEDRAENLKLFDQFGIKKQNKILIDTPYKQINYSDYVLVPGWQQFIKKYNEGEICL